MLGKLFEVNAGTSEGLLSRTDQGGCYAHLQSTELQRKIPESSEHIKDREGTLLKDTELIRERWVRFLKRYQTRKKKPCTSMIDGLRRRPVNAALGVELTGKEVAEALKSIGYCKALGPEDRFYRGPKTWP